MTAFSRLTKCALLSLSVLLCVSAHAEDKPDDTKANSKPPAQQLSDYELMSLFVEAFEQIESNYVRDVDRRKLVEAAIQGMVGELDQYSNFIPPQKVSRFQQMMEQEFGGIGIQVNAQNRRLVVVSPLPDTPAYHGGIRPGDVIVEVEGESTRDYTLSRAVEKLQGPVGRPVTLKVVHPGETDPVEMTLVRQLIQAPTVRGDRYNENADWEFMLVGEPRVGYIRVSHFSRRTADEVRSAVAELIAKDMQGLVIDLRFNPGGLLEVAIEMCDMFLEKGNIVSVRGRNVTEKSWDAKQGGVFPNFPIAILVNEYSASASEVFSACLQDNKRAVVIGERTWGKGSVQNVIRMEQGDSALKLTTASYHRPNGVNIHRFPDMTPDDKWGVTPDEGYLMPLTRRQWADWDVERSGRDVLQQKGATSEAKSAGSATQESDDSSDAKDPAEDESDDGGADAAGDKTPWEDVHLVAATKYIKEQLNGPKLAETGASSESSKVEIKVQPTNKDGKSSQTGEESAE